MPYTNRLPPQIMRAFEEAGLPCPPVPARLAPRLTELAPWVFSTRRAPRSPYEIAWHANEAESTIVEDYVVLGHAGHGIASWAMHYHLVHGPLGLFIQSEWGGAYMDAGQTKRAISTRFEQAGQLIQAVDAVAMEEGVLPRRHSLLIVVSDFYGSRWKQPGGEWEDAREPMGKALTWLRTLR